MNNDYKDIIDKFNHMLINFCEKNFMEELPNNAVPAINIIISAYMSAMMNIIYSMATWTEDPLLINAIDLLNRQYASIGLGELTVRTDH